VTLTSRNQFARRDHRRRPYEADVLPPSGASFRGSSGKYDSGGAAAADPSTLYTSLMRNEAKGPEEYDQPTSEESPVLYIRPGWRMRSLALFVFAAILISGCGSNSGTAGVACGVERWPVKTLSDRDAPAVNTMPQDTTVHALRDLPAPASLPQDSRVPPTELTVFKVTAVAMLAKREDDHDIHLVIANPDNPAETMIVEFPDVGCSGAADSAYKDNIKAARDEFDALYGEPGSSHFTSLQTVVQVTGVGFFDFLHGQTGVAPNGIELHPVLSITAVGSGPSSASPAASEIATLSDSADTTLELLGPPRSP
jgi:hypothetical protein